MISSFRLIYSSTSRLWIRSYYSLVISFFELRLSRSSNYFSLILYISFWYLYSSTWVRFSSLSWINLFRFNSFSFYSKSKLSYLIFYSFSSRSFLQSPNSDFKSLLADWVLWGFIPKLLSTDFSFYYWISTSCNFYYLFKSFNCLYLMIQSFLQAVNSKYFL